MKLASFPTAVLAAACAGVLALSGCATDGSSTGSGEDKPLSIFATTGYLGDAATHIAPNAEVEVLVKAGGDPHTYQPSTQDLEKMKQADVVLWNGLHLEAHMIDQLSGLGEKQISVGDAVSQDKLLPWPEKDENGNDLHDPHIWNDPQIWGEAVTAAAEKIGEIDTENADDYRANAEDYAKAIEDATAEGKEKLGAIPEDKRILVTGHDAFNYFGRTFDLEVHATDFVSSEAEKSAAEINELANLIAEKKVPTIFFDNLQNPQAITALQEAVDSKGWKTAISDDELFADTLGDSAPTDTYLGAFEHNISAISAGLGQ